jgi:hypothetical protein
MKYDYDKMSNDEIEDLYLDVFGIDFGVSWDDHTNHRQEIIDCIESGVPQDEDAIAGGWTEEDGVPGVDFAL